MLATTFNLKDILPDAPAIVSEGCNKVHKAISQMDLGTDAVDTSKVAIFIFNMCAIGSSDRFVNGVISEICENPTYEGFAAVCKGTFGIGTPYVSKSALKSKTATNGMTATDAKGNLLRPAGPRLLKAAQEGYGSGLTSPATTVVVRTQAEFVDNE